MTIRADARVVPRACLALLAWVAAAAALAPAARAGAQGQVQGAQACEKCHKPAVKKWKVEEPAQFGARAHANTHKQLADPKSAKFAAALGLADPNDPKEVCVACHATVVRGTLRGGVSCESCHGASSAWVAVHDKDPLAESYRKSLPLGLRDLHQKPAEIAAACVRCHATPQKALAAAGHPTGADFDAGAALKKLVHWTAAFTGDGAEHPCCDYAKVTTAASPLIAKALAGGGGATKTAAVKAPPPSARPGGGIASTSASPQATAAPQASTAPTRRATASPRPTTPAAPPAPWDWDQPVAPLPADYPSDEGADEAAPAEPARVETPAEAVAAGPTPERPRRARPVPPTSGVPDSPAIAPPPLVTPPDPQAAAGAPRASSATADAAALRGQGADLLARLLARGTRVPKLPPARKPQEFKGPDSELLHLQDIVLYLALETLRQPAAAPAAGKAAR